MTPPITSIRRGPQRPSLTLTSREQSALWRLNQHDGAWTINEGIKELGEARLRELLAHNLLGVVDTSMGEMVLLLAQGRIAALGRSSGASSLQAQLDRAYFRRSVAKLNWNLRPGGPIETDTFKLADTVHEVYTHGGPALATGKLGGGGLSATAIRRQGEWLKSTALSRGFTLYVLVPGGNRGQQYARGTAHVRVIRVLPQPDGALPGAHRHDGADAARGPTTYVGPYLSVPAARDHPEYQDLSPGVHRTLALPLAQRVERAMAAIEFDGVMTAGQLRRLYQVSPLDLPAIRRTPALMRTVPTQAGSETMVEFLTLSKKLAGREPAYLAHRAGTGRMRHLLDVAPEAVRWELEPRGRWQQEVPDARYTDARGDEYAVEFDGGRYSWSKIQSKLESAVDQGLRGTIWGVGSPQRRRTVAERFGGRISGDILLAQWWS